MDDDFEYDAFLSYTAVDTDAAREIHDKMADFQIRLFWSEHDLRHAVGTSAWVGEIGDSLAKSRHFILLCSPQSMESKWVKHEYSLFFDRHFLGREHERRFFIVKGKDYDEKLVPETITPVLPAASATQIIQYIFMEKISSQNENIQSLEDEISTLRNELTDTRDTVRKALQQYLYTKFWEPIMKNQDVHLFLCARGTPPVDTEFRGSGGRTSIDKWDYQTVLDLTHFIIRTYSSTNLIIEEPISKLPSTIVSSAGLFMEWDQITERIRDKDCIIIGSPDVSDLAEVVLAKLHAIAPYQPGREKQRGYVIIKKKMRMPSTFYWEKLEDEPEGVAQILDSGEFRYYPTKIDSEESIMYGILVIADNPFGEKRPRRKIMIFSGFSGVVTNAMAKLLTDEKYVDQLNNLDLHYSDRKNDVEILVGVKFRIEGGAREADMRKIVEGDDAVFYEGLVHVSDAKQGLTEA